MLLADDVIQHCHLVELGMNAKRRRVKLVVVILDR
jgi:hypothetical protein